MISKSPKCWLEDRALGIKSTDVQECKKLRKKT